MYEICDSLNHFFSEVQTFIHIWKQKQKAQIEISENMIVGYFNFPFLTEQFTYINLNEEI